MFIYTYKLTLKLRFFFFINMFHSTGLSWWLSGKESTCQFRRGGFNPWIGKEMATHSVILAWEIPRTEEPGGLQSMGSLKRSC